MNESALMKNFLKQNEMVVKKKSLRQALYPPLPKEGKDAKGLLEWKSRRFRFAHLDISELKVVQVAELLEEYQNLVKTCRKLMEKRRGKLGELKIIIIKKNISDDNKNSNNNY